MSVIACHDRPDEAVRRAGALPVRPRPMPREAAMGYIIRVAQANGLVTPRQLWHLLQSGQYQTPLEELMARAGISNRQREWLLGPLPRDWNSPVNLSSGLAINDYNHCLMRWCPLCLEESPHLRGVWGLKLQCVCTKHQVMLADRCPACGATQRFERGDIARCPCGARLTAAERVAAPLSLCRLCVWLAHGSVAQISPQLPELTASAWHRLVRYLGQFTVDAQPERPGQIAGLHRLEIATAVIANATNLLEAWPQHFNKLLAAIQVCEPATQSLPRSFGCLYHVLYRDLRAPCFQFLRDAFEAYLHENWWGFVCRRNRSFRAETIASHPRLTLRQAARQAGTEPAVVRHIVQAELIPAIEGAMPSGRHNRSVHQKDIEQIVTLTKDAMTLTEAAHRLALPERRIRELVAAGILTPIISRRNARSAAWLFSSVQLMPFFSVAGVSRDNVSPVSFRQIVKAWRLRDGEFVDLVKAIEVRALVPLSENPAPLGDVILDGKAVRARLSVRRASIDDWVSVDQAAPLLGVKQQVVYGLVACGLLPATAPQSRYRRISMASLRVFKETYVSLADLAHHQRHSPKWTLQSLDASPVCGPSVDGSRQYFFRRADVGAEKLPLVGRERMNLTSPL